MREIKFRAWDKRKKVWILDFRLDSLTGYVYYNYKDVLIMLKDAIVVEWTGLKDFNGKEIWEGDIVKFNTTPPGAHGKTKTCCGEVWYRPQECGYSVKSPQFRYSDGQYWIIGLCPRPDFYEVVGNIYENSELLKAQQ